MNETIKMKVDEINSVVALYGFLSNPFNGEMAFVTPLFIDGKADFFIQDINKFKKSYSLSRIQISNQENIIPYKGKNYKVVDEPLYAFLYEGHKVCCSSYKGLSSFLKRILENIKHYPNLFLEVLLFLNKFEEAKKFVTSLEFYNNKDMDVIEIQKKMELDEISKLEIAYLQSIHTSTDMRVHNSNGRSQRPNARWNKYREHNTMTTKRCKICGRPSRLLKLGVCMICIKKGLHKEIEKNKILIKK